MTSDKKIKPNILFLLIDSLRSDKCYGTERTCLTPNLDEMIKKGTFFNQAISSSDATTLSLKSMFTSQLPFKADTIKNVGTKTPTITDILKRSDYKISGTIPALDTTEAVYSEFDDNDKFVIGDEWPRLDDGLGLKIIKKIRTVLKEPWFYYVHILDIHSKIMPKMPPLKIPEKFDSKQFGMSMYERAISATDYWLGEILKNIDLEKTIIIITADHGSFIPYYQKNGIEVSMEGGGKTASLPKIKTPKFLNPLKAKMYNKIKNKEEKQILEKIEKLSLTEYEKRNLLSSFLESKKPFKIMYDEKIKVPLLFVGKNIPHGKMFNQQVSTCDILPTIIDILQIDEKISMDGHSLCPLMEEKNVEEKPIFIQSSFPLQKKSEYLVGIRTSKYKYNRSIDDPKQNVFLYDLQKDPKEERNIADEQTDIVDKYENLLNDCLSQIQNEDEKLDKSETKIVGDELRRLGYIN